MPPPSDPLDMLRAALPSAYDFSGFVDSGGQGAVFKATFNTQAVAVKLFRADTEPRRLEREISALRSIDCPYLGKVVDSQQIQIGGVSTTVVAYEFFNGIDLKSHLKPHAARLNQKTLASIGRHVGEA